MKVLIVKMSSMGDVIHTFPAVTEALRRDPTIEFHWVVEKSFVELVALHPGIKKIIPIEFRKWRKPWWKFPFRKEWHEFFRRLRAERYDRVIDAQGLLKSAFVAMKADGPCYGYNRQSIREPLASLFYQYRFSVNKNRHAIYRVMELFGLALGHRHCEGEARGNPGVLAVIARSVTTWQSRGVAFIYKKVLIDESKTTPLDCHVAQSAPRNDEPINYGLDRSRLLHIRTNTKNIVFLHGTTWINKQWPESYWQMLAKLFINAGYHVQLLWGNEEERLRAVRIASLDVSMEVMPRLNLLEAANVLASAAAVVAVDTGLGHLAAALDVPMVSVYGPTNSALTGALGKSQIHLRSQFPCSPCLKRECAFKGASKVWPVCFEEITPERVFAVITRAK